MLPLSGKTAAVPPTEGGAVASRITITVTRTAVCLASARTTTTRPRSMMTVAPRARTMSAKCQCQERLVRERRLSEKDDMCRQGVCRRVGEGDDTFCNKVTGPSSKGPFTTGPN